MRSPTRKQIAAAGLIGLAAFLVCRRETMGQCRRRGRLRSSWTRVGGLRMHALVSADPAGGDRPPIVLVHGLGMSSRYMVPLAQCLAPHLRVLAPDLPGFGLSEKPRHVLTVAELADCLAAWLDVAGVRRAACFGNSLGCEILVDFAIRHPERVTALILQGPTPDAHDANPVAHIATFAASGLFERPSLGLVALRDYLRCGIRRFAGTFADMVDNRIERKLPRVAAPTLVVRGSRDVIVPRRSAQRVASLLPNGRFVRIAGAAHGINYSNPRALRDCVLDFLSAQR